MMPPSTQQAMIGPGACSCAATVAGTRKMPLPMATPTDTATVCSRLTERGMRSPQGYAIKSLREQLDPVTHRHRGAPADMCEAADVGGGDEVGRAALESRALLPQQPARRLRRQDGIGSRRTAALVAVGNRGEGKAGGREQALDRAAELQGVLQSARRMEGDPRRSRRRPACCAPQRRGESLTLGAQHLSDVAGERTDARRPCAVVRIALQRSEEHTSELQSRSDLVCRLLLE